MMFVFPLRARNDKQTPSRDDQIFVAVGKKGGGNLHEGLQVELLTRYPAKN